MRGSKQSVVSASSSPLPTLALELSATSESIGANRCRSRLPLLDPAQSGDVAICPFEWTHRWRRRVDLAISKRKEPDDSVLEVNGTCHQWFPGELPIGYVRRPSDRIHARHQLPVLRRDRHHSVGNQSQSRMPTLCTVGKSRHYRIDSATSSSQFPWPLQISPSKTPRT